MLQVKQYKLSVKRIHFMSQMTLVSGTSPMTFTVCEVTFSIIFIGQVDQNLPFSIRVDSSLWPALEKSVSFLRNYRSYSVSTERFSGPRQYVSI
jgi:hypothetical protein